MKITIVPASTQAGKATISALLAHEAQPLVRAVYRDISKAPSQFTEHANFQAVRGGLDAGLDLDFSDSDAVFYVPPPTYDENVDTGEHASKCADRVKAALDKSSKAKKLVVLSALGAQHSEGIGILKINHITDKILSQSAQEVVLVRPGWFQENWAEALETTKTKRAFETHFTPADHKIAMVSITDVAAVVADMLFKQPGKLPSAPYAFDLHGPRGYSMLNLQAALEEVTGIRPAMEAVAPESLQQFFEQRLPQCKAQEVTEMTVAINGGGKLAGQMETACEGGELVRGKRELVETLRCIASGEVVKVASGAF